MSSILLQARGSHTSSWDTDNTTITTATLALAFRISSLPTANHPWLAMENASHLPGSLHSAGAELWGCHGLSTTKQTPPSNTTHGTHAWGSLGPSSSFLHQCAVRNHLYSRTVTLSLVMTSLFAFYWLHQAYIEKIKINTCYLKWCNEWVINIYKILCKNIYKKNRAFQLFYLLVKKLFCEDELPEMMASLVNVKK